MLQRLPGQVIAAILLGGTTAGAALLVLVPGPVAWFGSAVLFGGSFLTVVTAITGCAQQNAAPGSLGRRDRRADHRLRHRPVRRTGAGRHPVGPRVGGVPAGLAIGAALLGVSTLTVLTHRRPART
nr:hypothetical protein [Fodinicola feengrottensis]